MDKVVIDQFVDEIEAVFRKYKLGISNADCDDYDIEPIINESDIHLYTDPFRKARLSGITTS